ncbi:hypothetical protein MAR_003651 [Mya arenaria]|uniref:Uncharacterized protein n=1 Tax=Mya arenaria TaxID=6604 RepID=A0ABY7GA38_MYAAR|nr:hypothetical protein MAR_003651 [Mya arenaria]
MQCSEFGTWIPNETTMCILGLSGAPNISHMHATINTGLRKNGNESEVELYCELENLTSDNYYFTVSWGLSENSIWNEIVLISNPTISCQVTARYNQWSDEGPPIFSNEKFCGIKVHNESLNIYNSEIDTLYIELTVPFKCWMSVPACTIELKIFFNDTTDSCEIPGAARTYLYEANRRRKEDVGELEHVSSQGTLSLPCGITLSEKDVGKLRRFHVVSRPGSVSYPMEVLIPMHLSIDGNFESDGLFQNYTPNTVQVHVSTDYSKLQNKICYSHNDPHMKTFDGLKKKDESLNLKTDAKVKDEPNTEHMKIDHDQHSNDITSEPILETPVTTTEQDTDANDIQSEGDQHTNGKQSEPNHDTNGNQSKPDHDTIGIQSALDQETNDIAPGPEQDPKVMTSNNNHDMNDIESETDNRSFAIRHWKIIAIAFGLVSAACRTRESKRKEQRVR